MEFTTPDGQLIEPEFELVKKENGKPSVAFTDDDSEELDGSISDVTFDNGRLGFTYDLKCIALRGLVAFKNHEAAEKIFNGA